uniref:Uncharacterized protein n=1 Tax=Sphaerodactylus townsendi TaxID=933632 RepID=A0ACB8EUS2_9SAUR
MCSVLLTFILISVPSCVQATVTLRQPGSIQLTPSETLRLTCSVSGYSLSASGNAVSWVRQLPGKGLEWLCILYWNNDKRYLDSLRNRLTISIDSSRSPVSLEMRAMEAGDTGTYYCATRSQCTKVARNPYKYQQQGDSAHPEAEG